MQECFSLLDFEMSSKYKIWFQSLHLLLNFHTFIPRDTDPVLLPDALPVPQRRDPPSLHPNGDNREEEDSQSLHAGSHEVCWHQTEGAGAGELPAITHWLSADTMIMASNTD